MIVMKNVIVKTGNSMAHLDNRMDIATKRTNKVKDRVKNSPRRFQEILKQLKL